MKRWEGPGKERKKQQRMEKQDGRRNRKKGTNEHV